LIEGANRGDAGGRRGVRVADDRLEDLDHLVVFFSSPLSLSLWRWSFFHSEPSGGLRIQTPAVQALPPRQPACGDPLAAAEWHISHVEPGHERVDGD
jgi:hypothetical protein